MTSRGKDAWLAGVIVVIALVASLRPNTAEPVIRLTGLVLQLLGIGTVIWGISETRALFGYPSLSRKAKTWLSSIPLLRRTIVLPISSGTVSLSTGRPHVYQTHGPGANPTIEDRLDSLEKNVASIHERINREMDEILKLTGDALTQEEQSRKSGDRVSREQLEAASTGGVHISAIGALLLFVGIFLSTAATEISALLRCG